MIIVPRPNSTCRAAPATATSARPLLRPANAASSSLERAAALRRGSMRRVAVAAFVDPKKEPSPKKARTAGEDTSGGWGTGWWVGCGTDQ